MYRYLRRLFDGVVEGKDFEEGARVVLEVLSTWVEEIDDLEPRLVYGAVHLRTQRGYNSLISRVGSQVDQEKAPVQSTQVWNWVQQYRKAILIDTRLQQLVIFEEEPRRLQLDEAADSDGRLTQSVLQYIDREVTHIVALPLVDIDGGLAAMVTLEYCGPRRTGEVYPSASTIEVITMALDIMAPHLLGRPFEPRRPFPTDDLLPVAGATMAPTLKLLQSFARHNETLLLSGETGTGKSRLARWCHHQSLRRDEPFEVLDLLTIPESMHMARLVGWKRGAFTGADQDVDGAITRAQGGTLFIDEIDKLSWETQAGLLHLLEDRTYRILGDPGGERQADVRFIVGTNVDLNQRVREGKFRRDLYYRINVLPVEIPPLEKRRDELGDWARYMFKACAGGDSNMRYRFGQGALKELEQQSWPGNLRQLNNVIRRANIIARTAAIPDGDVHLITREHVLQAMAMEGNTQTLRVTDLLEKAATAFVTLAMRASEEGEGADLELTDAFSGHVIRTAVDWSENKAEAFRLLNCQSLVAHKNHYRRYQRGLEDIDTLKNFEKNLGVQRRDKKKGTRVEAGEDHV